MLANLRTRMRGFLKATGGNIAMTMALAAVPLVLATGAGIDYGRGLVSHSNMADALDAAALAVGKQTSKPTACSTASGSTTAQQTSCAAMKAVAQKFFDANYKGDTITGGTQPTVVITIANSGVTLSATDSVATTFLAAGGRLLGTTSLNSMAITASSTVVWGQTKLWVALVLDNSGSMSSSNKMTNLKSAAQTLLDTLEDASTTPGDVEVGIVPFTNTINLGSTTTTSSAWIKWSAWSSNTWGSVTADTPPGTTGPGDDCPFSYGCRDPGSNSSRSTIESSGSTKGYICPKAWSYSSKVDGSNGHTFMGCWTSVAASGTTTIDSGWGASCNGYSSSNCSCTGSNGSKVCKTKNWTHTTWVPETDKTLWKGCITDRDQNYDIQNTAPSGAAAYYAENNDNCPTATVTTLGHDWDTLSSTITAMNPDGSTNQAIGVAHGWQMLTTGNPYATPTLPSNTTRYIILLSDGLNTENRWYGNGSSENTTEDGYIDDRMKLTCDAAKADGVVIYTLFLNTNSSSDSAPLLDCATDSGKYYKITSSTGIATAFAAIGEQITNLRVSQ